MEGDGGGDGECEGVCRGRSRVPFGDFSLVVVGDSEVLTVFGGLLGVMVSVGGGPKGWAQLHFFSDNCFLRSPTCDLRHCVCASSWRILEERAAVESACSFSLHSTCVFMLVFTCVLAFSVLSVMRSRRCGIWDTTLDS